MALDNIVRGVDLRGQSLGARPLLGFHESVRVVPLDELATLSVGLIQRAAGFQTQPAIGGEHVWRVLSRRVKRRGCGPPRLRPTLPGPAGGAPGGGLVLLFGGTFFGGGAPLLGGAAPGGSQGVFKGLAALAADTDGLSEAMVVYVQDEAPGEAPQAARDAQRSSVGP